MADSASVKESLDTILEHVAKSLNIKSYELIPDVTMNYGDGFVASLYTGIVRNELTGKMTHVAIKRNPSFAFADYSAIFKNEADFYSKVIKVYDTLQKEYHMSFAFDNTPRFFSASLESKNEYIAMENLKPAGYVMVDKREFIDEEHWKLIFQVYGRLHALSFALKELKPKVYQSIKDGLTDGLVSLLTILMNQMEESFAATLAALDPVLDKDAYNRFKTIADNMSGNYAKVSQYQGNYNCITHGDCWSNNLLFKYSNTGKLEDMKLIDFQLCRESTPIHDLSYIFYSSASKQDLDKLDKYLDIYYKSFSRMARDLKCTPEKQLPLSVLKEEWKEYGLFGVYMSLFLWRTKLLSKEYLRADPERQAELVKELYEGEVYRKIVRNIVLHAVEYGII